MNTRQVFPLKLDDNVTVRNLNELRAIYSVREQDMVKFIENGQIETIFYGIGDMIKAMKEQGKKGPEIFEYLAQIIGVNLKDKSSFVTVKLPAKPQELPSISEKLPLKEETPKDLLLSNRISLDFSDAELKIDGPCIIKSGKTITGTGKTIFNINELTVEIAEHETVCFENIIFKKSLKDAVINITKGNVVFNNAVFEGVRIETSGKAKIFIKDSKFFNLPTAIVAKDSSLLTIESVSFDKINSKLILLKDQSDMINLIDFVTQYPELKDGLMLSCITGHKFLKEGLVNFSKLLLTQKNTKLFGEIKLDKPITISGEIISLEGIAKDALVISSNFTETFIIKNNGTLKCKNVIFKCTNDERKVTRSIHAEEIEDGEHHEKDSGFIYLKSGNLEISDCKITNSDIAICLEEHSKGEIKNCTLINNKKSGIILRSSKAKINQCNLEGNGEKGKNYPHIGLFNNSEIEIRNSNISNAINSDGVFICESKASIQKCSINNNNNGIDIRDTSEVRVGECDLKNNREEGIYIYQNSKVIVKKCNIINNRSNGFEIRENSDVEVFDCHIDGNIRGIDIKTAKVKISDCNIRGNVKGIYLELNSNAEILNCNITHSKMNGIYMETSRVNIIDCEVKNNGEKDEDNYQIYIGRKSRVNLKNSVVSDAGDKLSDVLSEFEGSKVITEDCDIEGNVTYGHKKDNCFITTATCLALNKGDNCYELNMFRYFRDNCLLIQADGESLIREYYSIAPNIVDSIEKSLDKYKIYNHIWNFHLSKCLSLIEEKKFELVTSLYKDMVYSLKREFLK